MNTGSSMDVKNLLSVPLIGLIFNRSAIACKFVPTVDREIVRFIYPPSPS